MTRSTPQDTARLTRLVGINLMLMLVPLTLLVFSSLVVVRILDEGVQWTVHTYQVRSSLSEVKEFLLEAESRARGYLLTDNPELIAGLDEYRKNVLNKVNDLSQLVSDNPPQVQRVGEIGRLALVRLDDLNRSIELHRQSKNEEMRSFVGGTGRQAMLDVVTRIEEALQMEETLLIQRRNTTYTAEICLVIVLLVGCLVVISVGYRVHALIRARLAPLSEAVDAALRISNGDLSEPISAPVNADEVGQLVGALGTMQDGLRTMVTRTARASESLDVATQQILTSIREQAATSQEQAAAIQQTSTTMQEISQSALQVAERARDMEMSAVTTTAAGVTGLESVQKSVAATLLIKDQAEVVARDILALSSKTQAVGDIVMAVNDLAERSNLLALNASILAAIGADAGGFTVVATEMKGLAQRSKEATIEVRGLLGDIQKGINRSVMLVEESVKRVESGNQNMEASDRSIRRLTDSIEESVGSVQQITAATNQQQLAFEQVTGALLNIRQAMEQSEAGSRQLEMAASNLSQLSGQLQEVVGQYRLPAEHARRSQGRL